MTLYLLEIATACIRAVIRREVLEHTVLIRINLKIQWCLQYMEVDGSIWNFSHFSEHLLGFNIQRLTAKYFRNYLIYEDGGIQLFCQAFTDSKKGWVQTLEFE